MYCFQETNPPPQYTFESNTLSMSDVQSIQNLPPHLKVLYKFSQLLDITEINFNKSIRPLKCCRPSLNLRPYLKVFHKLSHILWITNFKFNPSTRRLDYTPLRDLVSRIIFTVLAVISGFNLLMALDFVLVWYFDLMKLSKLWWSVLEEIDNLKYACVVFEYLSTYMFAKTFLKQGHTIVPVANEMLEIFELIKMKSKSRIRLSGSFRTAVVLKVLVFLLRIVLYTLSFNIILPCVRILANMVFFGHMYSQLVLISVYHKMNDFVEVAAEHMTQRELTRSVKDLLEVSFRVHQVKRSLNTFFSPLFLSTYLGVFMNIYCVCDILSHLMYASLRGYVYDYSVHILWTFPSMLTVSYNVYLIGRLSDMAAQSEAMFEERILVLFCRNMLKRTKSVKWEIDQLMLGSKVYECNYRECGLFKMDPQFSLHVITNVVLVNVLNYLQFCQMSMKVE